MPWTREKTATAVVVGLLLAVGIALVIVYSQAPSYQLALRTDHVLRDMAVGKIQWNAGMSQLWSMGPEIVPCLARQARAKNSSLTKAYDRLWTKMPALLQRHFPRPVDRAQLRLTAIHAIQEFGPLTVRRAAPQVIADLKESIDPSENDSYYAARGAGEWLLPDSPSALVTFESGLAATNTNWPEPRTFFNVADTTWHSVPELLPFLTDYLDNPSLAYHAAIALGRIGPKAAQAIPALIQVIDQGAAGEYTNARAARFYLARVYSNPLGWHTAQVIQDPKGMDHNRAMAALALGRIGQPAPAVCAALARAWNAPDAWVRQNAALATELLAPSMTNELPQLLNGLWETNNGTLGKKILAIGKLGPPARDALPTLRELSKPSRLQTFLGVPETKVVGDNADDLSIAAKMAICRIAPEEGRPFLPDIANRIGFWWDPVLFLTEPSPWSNDVVRVVEPLLEEHSNGQGGTVRPSLAAYIILSHDRQHAKALAVLRRNLSTGDLNDRLLAGRLLFEAIGETNGLCKLVDEGFRSPNSFIGQSAGNLADKMGDAARPSLSAFKAALWHQDQFVRAWAGRLILKLAPQELPINEGNAGK